MDASAIMGPHMREPARICAHTHAYAVPAVGRAPTPRATLKPARGLALVMRAGSLLPVALLLAASLLVGCLEGGGPAPATGAVQVAMRDLDQGASSAIDEPVRRVVADDAAWAAFWAEHAADQIPAPAPPEVDFAKERVLAVVMGQKSSGCFGIAVTNVTRDGPGVVHARVESFEGGPVCAAVLTSPYHFVAIEDRTSQVAFEDANASAPPPPPPTTTPSTPPRDEREELSTRTLARGDGSNISEETRVILREGGAWSSFWSRHAGGAAPDVSFPNESVVAIVLGDRSGCGSVRIERVSYILASRQLAVEFAYGPTDVQCFRAVIAPYDIVAIPGRPGDVVFIERDASGRAEPVLLPPGAGTPTPSSPEPPVGDFAFRTLDEGVRSGYTQKERFVVTNITRWRDAWATHGGEGEPPTVDFANEYAFVAAAGDKGSGCWSIRVKRIDVQEGMVWVHVATTGPPPEAYCAAVVTQPYHFVTYPRSDAPFMLVES